MGGGNESVPRDAYFEANRQHWGDLVGDFSLNAESDRIAGFLNGETGLLPLELEEMGDVGGKTLLHLQCLVGLRTLSWAREGATVTGVDFSTEAIEAARHLATETGLDERVTFVESNVYDLPSNHDERHDVVYTSLGVLCWLPDLAEWADVVAKCLKPGGTFYLVEVHPLADALSIDFEDGDVEIGIENPYFTPETPVGTGDTAGSERDGSGRDAVDQGPYKWSHGLGELLTALLDAGIEPSFVHEYPFAAHEQFPGMVQDEDGYWRFESGLELPLLVTVKGSLER